jgi:hypothetical protein
MANTFTLISSNVLSSDTASISLTAIPATYTDLVFRMSTRTTRVTETQSIFLKFNSDGTTTKYSRTFVRSDLSTSSGRQSSAASVTIPFTTGSTATSNTFNSSELYIPNYAGSTNKPFSAFGAPENNTVDSVQYLEAMAGLYSETAAISSIQLTLPTGNFVSGSSFYLYGIKNS